MSAVLEKLNAAAPFLTPTLAIKSVKIALLIWATLMTAFPEILLSTYQIEAGTGCPAKPKKGSPPCNAAHNEAFVAMCVGVFGVQLMFSFIMITAMSHAGVSAKAQAVMSGCIFKIYLLLGLNDYWYMLSPEWPASSSKDGVYANLVLFASFAFIGLAGWSFGGQPMPHFIQGRPSLSNITAAAQARFGTPLFLSCGVLTLFALPLIFMREDFIKQFGYDLDEPSGLGDDAKFIALLMLGNAGKTQLLNVMTTVMVLAAEPANEDTAYRMLRAHSFAWLFLMGRFGGDAVKNIAIGHTDPARTPVFLFCFAVTYLIIDSFTSTPIQIKNK